jgi:hypothetical protein
MIFDSDQFTSTLPELSVLSLGLTILLPQQISASANAIISRGAILQGVIFHNGFPALDPSGRRLSGRIRGNVAAAAPTVLALGPWAKAARGPSASGVARMAIARRITREFPRRGEGRCENSLRCRPVPLAPAACRTCCREGYRSPRKGIVARCPCKQGMHARAGNPSGAAGVAEQGRIMISNEPGPRSDGTVIPRASSHWGLMEPTPKMPLRIYHGRG